MRRREISPFKAGLMTATVVFAFAFFAFTKINPFANPYELKAVFQNTAALQPKSPVRIAGVEVGAVKKIEPEGGDSSAAMVTMEIKRNGLPIHRDAQAKIRPRIFLEGNFFVDLQPGTPGSDKVSSGYTIPVAQTSAPVQLDQVLTALQASTRKDLQTLVNGYGDALFGRPLPGEDADQDPSTKGETAAKSLNDSLKYAPDALRGVATVNQALLGTQVHDLSGFIKGQQKISTALASREQSLKDLVTNFNRTLAAFASEQGNLRTTVHLLPGVLEKANPLFDNLNASFPATRAFAREILPGVRETPATIDAAFPWIAQTRRLVSPAELQGLARDLRPAVGDLARLTNGTVTLLPQVDLVSKCFTKVVLPAGDIKVNDPPLSTGLENYKEFFQTLVGLSGESQNFDGNGQYTRFQTGGGAQQVSTGDIPGQGALVGNAAAPPIGSRPAAPAARPPYNRKVACYTNKLPDVNGAKTGPGE
ncbi:MAG: phospholipid/cholesterol/gamma-HCH transport system substrate-binding protein [Thermoleophilaceae bacterium]|nr:phospholipid/cholesterol/gamma-HCH transport system substrate-binding protein [Thermoleophilaceae bacterium]